MLQRYVEKATTGPDAPNPCGRGSFEQGEPTFPQTCTRQVTRQPAEAMPSELRPQKSLPLTRTPRKPSTRVQESRLSEGGMISSRARREGP